MNTATLIQQQQQQHIKMADSDSEESGSFCVALSEEDSDSLIILDSDTSSVEVEEASVKKEKNLETAAEILDLSDNERISIAKKRKKDFSKKTHHVKKEKGDVKSNEASVKIEKQDSIVNELIAKLKEENETLKRCMNELIKITARSNSLDSDSKAFPDATINKYSKNVGPPVYTGRGRKKVVQKKNCSTWCDFGSSPFDEMRWYSSSRPWKQQVKVYRHEVKEHVPEVFRNSLLNEPYPNAEFSDEVQYLEPSKR